VDVVVTTAAIIPHIAVVGMENPVATAAMEVATRVVVVTRVVGATQVVATQVVGATQVVATQVEAKVKELTCTDWPTGASL